MLLGWQGGWRQFRLHFSYSTSSAWASNDSEFLDKESTFTIYNLQSDALHICDTSHKQWHWCPANVKVSDSQTKHLPPDWIRWQSRCILRRHRLSILGCILSFLLQLSRGYYLKLSRTKKMSSPERIWESYGVCIKFQIAKHVKVGSGADGRMPPISPPVLAWRDETGR